MVLRKRIRGCPVRGAGDESMGDKWEKIGVVGEGRRNRIWIGGCLGEMGAALGWKKRKLKNQMVEGLFGRFFVRKKKMRWPGEDGEATGEDEVG